MTITLRVLIAIGVLLLHSGVQAQSARPVLIMISIDGLRPDYVTAAAPEVKTLYEFQITHGELMRYMPCFCGCGQSGHKSNRDCFIKSVRQDGRVEFETMAPTCDICLGVTRQTMRMLDQGKRPREIRAAIDRKYADKIDMSTPTPYPPE